MKRNDLDHLSTQKLRDYINSQIGTHVDSLDRESLLLLAGILAVRPPGASATYRYAAKAVIRVERLVHTSVGRARRFISGREPVGAEVDFSVRSRENRDQSEAPSGAAAEPLDRLHPSAKPASSSASGPSGAADLDESEMNSAADLSRRFGVTKPTVTNWHKAGRLIGWKSDAGAWEFPAHQLDENDVIIDGLADVLIEFAGQKEAWRWLITPNKSLGGETPLHRLRSGNKKEVRAAAAQHRAMG